MVPEAQAASQGNLSWDSSYVDGSRLIFVNPKYLGTELNDAIAGDPTPRQWAKELGYEYAAYEGECLVPSEMPNCRTWQEYETYGFNYGQWEKHTCRYNNWTWDNCYARTIKIMVHRSQSDPVDIAYTPESTDFGAPAPGEIVEKTVTIQNNSSYTLSDMQFGFYGLRDGSRFEVVSNDLGQYLPAGQSATVTIRYTATRRGFIQEEAHFDYMYDTTKSASCIISVQAGIREENTRTFGTQTCQQTSNDPVALATGELLHGPEEIINLGGPLPLTLQRWQAGRMARENLSDDPQNFLGHNWLHNYMIRIEKTGAASVELAFRWGERLTFTKQEDQWQLAAARAVPFQLRQDGGGAFHLLDPTDDRIYSFLTDGRLKRIRDRNGNCLLITYVDEGEAGAPGSIETISDGLGRSLTGSQLLSPTGIFQIDADRRERFSRIGGYLTSSQDMLGNTTRYRYAEEVSDSGFQLEAIERPLGNTPWTSAFDSQGRVVKQTDAYGNIWTFAYDTPEAGVTRITDPDGRESFSRHTVGASWTGFSDPTGKSYAFTTDEAGRPTEAADRLGEKTDIAYHAPSGRLASVTDARGQTTTYTYTAQEQTFTNPDNDQQVAFTLYNLTRVDYPDGTFETFTHDARGNALTHSDQAEKTSSYAYNGRGQVLTATNPVGGVTTYTYNDDATLASRTDSDTGMTTYGYDAYKRLNLVTHPDETTVRMVYNKKDQLATYTDELNRTTGFTYDANGNLIKITDPDGGEITYEYDLMDRLVKTTDHLGQETTRTYDAMNRLAAMADATGVKIAYQYDPRGWRNRVTRAGKTWTTAYDDEGIPVAYTTPLNHTTAGTTDKLGLTASVSDSLDRTTTFGRDAMNRVTSITYPDNRVTTYTYNPLGLLSGVVLPGNRNGVYTYNGLGFVDKITDFNGKQWDVSYTQMGRLQRLTDPLNRYTQCGYDARGRLNAVTYPDGGTQAITRDSAGNVTRRLYSDGPDLQFTYDTRDRLLTANDLTLTRDAEGRIISTIDGDESFDATYDDAGRLKTAAYNNAFTVTYSYSVGADGSGLLTGVGDSLTETQISFAYDEDRRLTKIGMPNGETILKSWDNADRLTRLQSGSHVDVSMTYDMGGRITAVNLTAPLTPEAEITTTAASLTYDAASQISTEGYSYDARGRMTAAPGRTYAWDGASRLTGVDSVSLTYNGLGAVRTRTQDGVSTQFYYNHAIGLTPMVAEKNETAGQFLRYYVWTPGGRLLYMIDAADGNKVYFYHFDQTGSTLALTDAAGNVTDAYAYDPYGRIVARTGDNQQPFTFVGAWGVRREGAGGDLYQMRARYYVAVTGRFLSPEPVWPQLHAPRALNPYQYAGADPIRFIDPTGLTFQNDPDLEQQYDDICNQQSNVEQELFGLREEQREMASDATSGRVDWFDQVLDAFEDAGMVGAVAETQKIWPDRLVDINDERVKEAMKQFPQLLRDRLEQKKRRAGMPDRIRELEKKRDALERRQNEVLKKLKKRNLVREARARGLQGIHLERYVNDMADWIR